MTANRELKEQPPEAFSEIGEILSPLKDSILSAIFGFHKVIFKYVRDFFLADAEAANLRAVDTRVGQREISMYCAKNDIEPEFFYGELPAKITKILEDGPSKVVPTIESGCEKAINVK